MIQQFSLRFIDIVHIIYDLNLELQNKTKVDIHPNMIVDYDVSPFP